MNACKSRLTAKRIVIALASKLKVASVLFVALALQSAALAQTVVHPFMTPNAIVTAHALQSPNESDFEDTTFEWLLESTAKENDLSIWCDRRISRDKLITIKRKDGEQSLDTIEQLLSAACDKVDAAILPMDGVVAVVPKSKRDLLATVYWKLLQSKKTGLVAGAISKQTSWDDGAIASDLLEQFRSVHLPSISSIPEVEYDLWPAFRFQKASIASVSVCLLSSFDLCLVESEQGPVIQSLADFESSIERGALVEWLYEQKEVDRTKEEDRKAWKQRWTDSKVGRSVKPVGFRVNATVMAHYDFVRLLIPPRPKRTKSNAKVFSGEIKSDLQRLLGWISNRSQLEFHPLPLPPEYASKEIRLNVQKVTMEELLELVSKQALIEFKKTGERVEIILPDR